MKISNTHQRTIAAPVQQVGAIMDTLASQDDRMWPHGAWPAVRFDRPLQVGATGGHGPIRYTVSHYERDKRVRFEFEGNWNGYHECSLQDLGNGACRLTHTLQANPSWMLTLAWHSLIIHMHNALVEDLFDKVEGQFNRVAHPQVWSVRVRFLRYLEQKAARK